MPPGASPTVSRGPIAGRRRRDPRSDGSAVVVLGLIDSKPSSAAILRDGRIEAAIAEERLCRMKLASGMPRAAITEVMRLARVSPGDIDQVTVAQRVSVFEPKPIPWKGWFKDQELKTRHFDRVS